MLSMIHNIEVVEYSSKYDAELEKLLSVNNQEVRHAKRD